MSPSSPSSRSLQSVFRRNRFMFLACFLLASLAVNPAVQYLQAFTGPVLTSILLLSGSLFLLLGAVGAVSRSRWQVIFAIGMAFLIILNHVLALSFNFLPCLVLYMVFFTVFLLEAEFLLLRYLFRPLRVTMEVIYASLCAYLLLGFLWAFFYSLIDMANPDAFVFAYETEAKRATLNVGSIDTILPLYYSLVTLTTLGYGDLVPMSGLARMFAALEAVIGQIYLTVLVARLVGLHVSQKASETEAEHTG